MSITTPGGQRYQDELENKQRWKRELPPPSAVTATQNSAHLAGPEKVPFFPRFTPYFSGPLP